MPSGPHSPFFSICIPQYNRTSFLIAACRSLSRQTFKDFEICISDDCSTDARQSELLAFLSSSGMSFTYRMQERNVRYDANLRAAIAMAKGRYCFLLGNDDCLHSELTLEGIHEKIVIFGFPGVIITNFEDYATGRKVSRIRGTLDLGKGPQVAASFYRNFSFVSGIILDRALAQGHVTDRWDGSQMYQMFLGCRILAEGRSLLGLDLVAIRKGIQMPGEQVDSYHLWPRVHPCPVKERKLPMIMIGRLVMDAIAPYVDGREAWRLLEKVFSHFLLFTYSYWLVEYRRVQSWKYAMGICLGSRPRNLLENVAVPGVIRLRLRLLHCLCSFVGLLFPVRLFTAMYPFFHFLAKAIR